MADKQIAEMSFKTPTDTFTKSNEEVINFWGPYFLREDGFLCKLRNSFCDWKLFFKNNAELIHLEKLLIKSKKKMIDFLKKKKFIVFKNWGLIFAIGNFAELDLASRDQNRKNKYRKKFCKNLFPYSSVVESKDIKAAFTRFK